MSRKPWSRTLRAVDSSTRWNTSSGTVIVPGNRMWPVRGRRPSCTASTEPHRAESCDPLLGRGMRGEEAREALPRQGIDDEQVRGGGIRRQRLDARGHLDLLEGLGEAV